VKRFYEHFCALDLCADTRTERNRVMQGYVPAFWACSSCGH
jgi:hypothetical protein